MIDLLGRFVASAGNGHKLPEGVCAEGRKGKSVTVSESKAKGSLLIAHPVFTSNADFKL
jgi:hypothetical protein